MTLLNEIISSERYFGIEPSAILTFKDEYPELVDASLKNNQKYLASNRLTLIHEFLEKEMKAGRIEKKLLVQRIQKKIKLHGHCQAESHCFHFPYPILF